MAKIKVLPDVLANKIAAGEVVERPASVVKELLENALDAGAGTIKLAVESGGKRLIRVVDDGEGMTRDDAIVAFERHATSKVRTIDDLDSITTLGFRGEALPSIASVSRLTLRTKAPAEPVGTEVEFIGGKLANVRDLAWPGGTEVEVKDLFFNIPARKKFLKGDATESYHITNLVQHYALANSGLSFLLVNNGRDAIRVAPARSLKERAYQVLGSTMLNKLLEVKAERDGLKIEGFVSNPQEQRSSRDQQYLFVNRRFVRDQLIGRAVSEAYRSMMPSGTYPAVVLFIDVPPAEVDVNVHPAKTEVRFLHEGMIAGFVRDALVEAIRATEPTVRMGLSRSKTSPGPERDSERGPQPYPARAWDIRDRFDTADRLPDRLPDRPPDRPMDTPVEGAPDTPNRLSGSAASPTLSEAMNLLYRAEPDLVTGREDSQPAIAPGGFGPLTDPSSYADSEFAPDLPLPSGDGSSEPAVPAPSLPHLGHGIKPMGQIRDSYIVATDDEGLLLVDQHVAHERILFEQFRDVKLARPADVQALLIPETIDLSPAEADAFGVVQEELESIGIETMQLSGRTVAIKTAPAGLGAREVMAVVTEVIGAVERDRRSFSIEHIRDAIAASLACKAAIKVNMPLTSEKMQWLIDELMKTKNPMTCPHGRPIVMRMELRDIEKGFKRPV